jgi:hypothetical protein
MVSHHSQSSESSDGNAPTASPVQPSYLPDSGNIPSSYNQYSVHQAHSPPQPYYPPSAYSSSAYPPSPYHETALEDPHSQQHTAPVLVSRYVHAVFVRSAEPLLTASNSSAKYYPCLVPGCPTVNSFTRATDLNRHVQTVHFPKRVDCKYQYCGRVGENGFSRVDHLNEHLREVHKDHIPKKSRRKS